MTDPTPTPADVAPKTGDPAPTQTPTNPEPAAAAPAEAKPPWGDDFDAEKAWTLVQNLRADKEKLSKRETLTAEQKQKLAEFDRLEAASKSELERAQELASKNGERAQALLDRAAQAEIKALSSDFADPDVAQALLAGKKYATEDGDIDTEQIKADLADLLAKKPHLGKQPESRTPAPNPAQGSSGAGQQQRGPAQLTKADVDRLYAAKDYAAIDKARAEGQLRDYLGS